LATRERLHTIIQLVTPQGPLSQWYPLHYRFWETVNRKDDAAARDADQIRKEMKEFAARIDFKNTLPPTLAYLGRSLLHNGLTREGMEVLRLAHWQHPGSFEINHDLAWGYLIQRPPQLVESLRHYSAAVAARPRTAGL